MPEDRNLTQGEIALLQAVYGPRIPYPRVKVHPHRLTWPLPNDRAMAPNGDLYLPGTKYSPDFAAGDVSLLRKSLFIHEGTHLYH